MKSGIEDLANKWGQTETIPEDVSNQIMEQIGVFIMPEAAAEPAAGAKTTHPEALRYRELIAGLLQRMDDRSIYKTKGLPMPYKAYLMKLKYGDGDFSRSWFVRRLSVGATILQAEGDHLHLEGLSKLDMAGSGAVCYVQDNKGNKYDLTHYWAAAFDKFTSYGDLVQEGIGFKVDLPLQAGARYEFILAGPNGKKQKLAIRFGKFSRLTSAIENTYFAEGNHLVKYRDNRINVYDLTLKSLLAAEYRYEKDLKAAGKGYLVGLRRQAIWKKRNKKRPLWLISDRTNIAGDNGEALYRHMIHSGGTRPYDYCFVIDKSSRGYETLGDLKGIVDYTSKDYRLKFLTADKIISSQWADWVYNAFGEDRDYMKDLHSFRFIFLRHGVMKNDMSAWAHKLRKNISMIFATTRSEWSVVTNGTYGYEAHQVKLAGMPRYDLLRSEPEKIISIMPTWRKYIPIETTRGRSERLYSAAFKETGYFRFYNDLINDSRLLQKMSDKGYRGNFYVHPLFEAQHVDFVGNQVIHVAEGTADYNKVFRESSLLVTDYSSVDMDFAYMKKPLVYTQFDKELFFSTHTYREGAFDTQRDGFGPVCFDYESTVAKIIEYLDNDCVQEQVYRDRVDSFFEFTDNGNCARVLAAIEEV